MNSVFRDTGQCDGDMFGFDTRPESILTCQNLTGWSGFGQKFVRLGVLDSQAKANVQGHV